MQKSEESQCFTHDLLRHTARIIPLTFDSCFSCPTTDVARSRCLLRTLQAAQVILPMSPGFRDALGILFCRLLILKLEDGPKNPSHPSVRVLASHLSNEGDSCLRLTPFHATAILGLLTTEEWGDTGIELRVRVSCVFDADEATDRTRFLRSRFCVSILVSWMVRRCRLSRTSSRGMGYMTTGRGS